MRDVRQEAESVQIRLGEASADPNSNPVFEFICCFRDNRTHLYRSIGNYQYGNEDFASGFLNWLSSMGFFEHVTSNVMDGIDFRTALRWFHERTLDNAFDHCWNGPYNFPQRIFRIRC
jgi:hypothetical protein